MSRRYLGQELVEELWNGALGLEGGGDGGGLFARIATVSVLIIKGVAVGWAATRLVAVVVRHAYPTRVWGDQRCAPA